MSHRFSKHLLILLLILVFVLSTDCWSVVPTWRGFDRLSIRQPSRATSLWASTDFYSESGAPFHVFTTFGDVFSDIEHPTDTPLDCSKDSQDICKKLPLDILEGKSSYEILVDIPGSSKEDIKLSMNGRNLVITADRRPHDSDKMALQKSERFVGTKRRTIKLASDMDIDTIKATCSNGVLAINISKVSTSATEKATGLK